MKNIVIFDEYNEVDLKPSALLQKYTNLSNEDVQTLLNKKGQLQSVVCPGCGTSEVINSFEKFSLTYNECATCASMYVSPRPTEEALRKFYKESKARAFWREEFAKVTNSKRKEKIIKPRIEWITDSTSEYYPDAKHFVDINTNHFGYIKELAQSDQFQKKSLVDPFVPTEELDAKDMDLVDMPWQALDWTDQVDVVSLFEVLDRTSDVDALLKSIHQMLKSGGLVFMTAILASGFDVQTLGEKADNIYPPDRLNVFTIEGLQKLFSKHGYECLEFSTPGILDLEIVRSAQSNDSSISLPKFVDYLLNKRGKAEQQAFQEFLQANQLSSYGRILIRKK